MTGFGVDAGEMGSTADKIDGVHDKVTASATDVGKSNIEAADFGREHKDHGQPFTDLVTKLGKLVTAQATAMANYNSTLRDTKAEYDASEWANTDIFTKTSGT